MCLKTSIAALSHTYGRKNGLRVLTSQSILMHSEASSFPADYSKPAPPSTATCASESQYFMHQDYHHCILSYIWQHGRNLGPNIAVCLDKIKCCSAHKMIPLVRHTTVSTIKKTRCITTAPCMQMNNIASNLQQRRMMVT